MMGNQEESKLDSAFERFAAQTSFVGYCAMDDDDFERLDQPGSLMLDEDSNRVLRIPNKDMQITNQVQLNRMLFQIRSKPEAFKAMVHDRRRQDQMNNNNAGGLDSGEGSLDSLLYELEHLELSMEEQKTNGSCSPRTPSTAGSRVEGFGIDKCELEVVTEEGEEENCQYDDDDDDDEEEEEEEEDEEVDEDAYGSDYVDDGDNDINSPKSFLEKEEVEEKEEKCPESCSAFERGERKLQRYQVQAIAGKGSFSVVYVASRNTDGKKVALKCVELSGMESEKAQVKCSKEIRALQSLKHPNIIGCEDYFHTPRGLFIVLEWAAAGDLKRMLRRVRAKRSRFHEKVIWSYFLQISQAVSFMHSHRIIHRDIKPSNIFITPDGKIKIGDLGLSRALSQETVKAYSKVGTPLFMAPEVLQGCGHDFKSDVWSLGCVLYELAMLHSPFEVGCKTMKSVFNRILQAQYHPVSGTYSQQFCATIDEIFSLKTCDRPHVDLLVKKAQEQVAKCTETVLTSKT